MLIQLLYLDEYYLPELTYLCRVFSSILQEVRLSPCHISRYNQECPYSIGYCSGEMALQLPPACRIHIHTDDLFWKRYSQKEYPEIQKREHAGLVALNTNNSRSYITRDTDGISTNLDIFASAFFMITCMEEILNSHLRDEHGRFKFSMSRWAHLYVDEALINIYAQTILKWINAVYEIGIPSNRTFTAVLSHDIDIPYYYGRFRSELTELLNSSKSGGKYRRFPDLQSYLACLLGIKDDPYDTFSYINGREGKRGIPATYFIMLSRDNAWGLDRQKYSRTLKDIYAEGNEIALHSGYESYYDTELISQEKRYVESLSDVTIDGSRSHFLRFKLPETYYILSNLGLSYDSTMGYPDREGFKAGICTPYKPFDIHRREQIDIMEIPLVVMDGTLREYRKQSPEDALSNIEKLIKQVSSCNGVIVFNWHNSFLVETDRDWRNIYERSLEYLVAYGAQFLTCREVASIWKDFWS